MNKRDAVAKGISLVQNDNWSGINVLINRV